MRAGALAIDDPNPCLRCKGKLTCGSVRGLCPRCYESTRRRVAEGSVTWKKIEGWRMALPRSPGWGTGAEGNHEC